jgi:MFS family permease
MPKTSQTVAYGLHEYSKRERLVIMGSTMLGFALDMYNLLIVTFLMTTIQRSLNISLTQAGAITTATLIGSVIGGGGFGWIGDRMGRKTSLQLTLGVFSVGAIASAFAWDYPSLLVVRFLAGIGLGGEWGAGMVLFNEVWDPGRRGLGSALIQASNLFGLVGATLVGVWATTQFSPYWGWRIALLTGGAPILLMVAVRYLMPESRIWLRYKQLKEAGQLVDENRTPLFDIFRSRLIKHTLTGIAWLASYMFCFYGVSVYIPTLFLKVLHATPGALRSTIVTSQVIGFAGYLFMGWCNDRFGRRHGALVPTLMWIASLIGIWAWGHTLYQGALLVWPMFWLYLIFHFGNTALGVSGPWLSELYPVGLRATAVSFIYMGGRAVGSIAPILVPIIASKFDNSLVAGMMVTLPVACIGLLAVCILPETRGRDLAAIDTSSVPAAAKALSSSGGR